MMRWYGAICAAVFAAFAFVQLNDPDSLPWVIGYGALALHFLAMTFGYAKRPLFWAGAMLSLVICAWYSPSIVEFLFNSDGMGFSNSMSFSYPYIEETREALGLFIAAIMQLIAIRLLPHEKIDDSELHIPV
ncbi:transmembrane 220 family protein [Corallincola platygyrae]|uniref:Transmembrane 220 family protein n=1 Tax=Corallincola platygyrae TaxID=1193278 RepID=A0ABW4XKL7_9GAMM